MGVVGRTSPRADEDWWFGRWRYWWFGRWSAILCLVVSDSQRFSHREENRHYPLRLSRLQNVPSLLFPTYLCASVLSFHLDEWFSVEIVSVLCIQPPKTSFESMANVHTQSIRDGVRDFGKQGEMQTELCITFWRYLVLTNTNKSVPRLTSWVAERMFCTWETWLWVPSIGKQQPPQKNSNKNTP